MFSPDIEQLTTATLARLERYLDGPELTWELAPRHNEDVVLITVSGFTKRYSKKISASYAIPRLLIEQHLTPRTAYQWAVDLLVSQVREGVAKPSL